MNFKEYLLKFSYPLIFILGLAVGIFMSGTGEKFQNQSGDANMNSNEIREGGFKLINPLLECETNSNLEFHELAPFKYKIQNLIDEKIKNEEASHISIYFRDLNNGPWTGINEKENFAPASLLKLPIMIAYFRMAESDPSLLSKIITFDNEKREGLAENIRPKEEIELGKSYTVEDLIRRMIIFSDNSAANLLRVNANRELFYKPYKDLGIIIEDIVGLDDFMSVKTYASFFRILFNASYLSRNFSQKALEILSQSDFKDGLVAGVPEGVTVAHKFGERIFKDGTKDIQVHDCGIIYYPSRPYLLCIMTKGKNFNILPKVIAEISRLVYDEVDKQKGN